MTLFILISLYTKSFAMFSDAKTEARLPYKFYLTPVLLFIAIGTASCLYLATVHYRNYVDLNYASICAISKAINCDTVAQSPYSILFGLPLAHWGAFGFTLLCLMVFNTKDQLGLPLWWIVFALGLTGSFVSVYYGYISSIKIDSYCIFCLVCYLCIFSITFLSFIIIRRFNIQLNLTPIWESTRDSLLRKINIWILCILCFSNVTLQLFLPHYWEFSLMTSGSDVATGVTDDGHPWIGATNPTLIIDEYSDYQCFQCSKMHNFLRLLTIEHANSLRLVHHNYPMDHLVNPLVQKPFHVGAGYMALLAIYAAEKGKFWEANDELFRQVRLGKEEGLNIKELANKTGLPVQSLQTALRDVTLQNKLFIDIRQGMQLGITGTPAFVIDGQVYMGAIPMDILEKLSP